MNTRQLTYPPIPISGSGVRYKRDSVVTLSLASSLVALSFLYSGSSAIYSLTYFNTFGIITLVWWFFAYFLPSREVALRPAHKMIGKFTFICIFIYSAILFGHSIANKFGLGQGVVGTGGREILEAIIVILYAFVLLSGRLSLGKPEIIPLCGLAVGFFLFGLDLVNYLAPSLYPILTRIYPVFNNEAPGANISAGAVAITRLMGLREIGYFLALFALCRIYFQKGFLKNAYYIIIFSVAGILIIFSGFRGYLVMFFMMVFLSIRKRTGLALMGIIIAGLVALSALNVTQMPDVVQRTLSFLPGNWYADSVDVAEGGFEWRAENYHLFMLYIFPQHPWLGSGVTDFGLNADELLENWNMVETQGVHSGFYSTLNIVGIIGLIFLILGSLRAYWNCFYLMVNDNFLKPWMLWVVSFFVTLQFWFWATFYFQSQFMQISVCMVVLELIRAEVASQKEAAALSMSQWGRRPWNDGVNGAVPRQI